MDRKPFKKRTIAWITACAAALLVLAVITAPPADGRLHHPQRDLVAETAH